MKRSSTIFLQAVIVLIAIGALAVMLWEPHIEGTAELLLNGRFWQARDIVVERHLKMAAWDG